MLTCELYFKKVSLITLSSSSANSCFLLFNSDKFVILSIETNNGKYKFKISVSSISVSLDV